MKIPANREGAIFVGAVVLGFIAVALFLKKQASDAANAVGGVLSGNNPLTLGTPYQDQGIFGTLGAGTNKVLGGAPQTFGDWLGGALYSLVHGSTQGLDSTPLVNQSDPNSPVINTGTISNPVQASPVVVPNTYKQAVQGTPPADVLGTDALFTPAPTDTTGYWNQVGLNIGAQD